MSPLDDLTDDDQASESVVATLAASADYIVGAANQATVTIDEEPPPTVTIAATTSATAELSSSPGVFTVTRTGPTDGALAVSYQMSGTAVNGSDYSNLTGSVTIPMGRRRRRLTFRRWMTAMATTLDRRKRPRPRFRPRPPTRSATRIRRA